MYFLTLIIQLNIVIRINVKLSNRIQILKLEN